MELIAEAALARLREFPDETDQQAIYRCLSVECPDDAPASRNWPLIRSLFPMAYLDWLVGALPNFDNPTSCHLIPTEAEQARIERTMAKLKGQYVSNRRLEVDGSESKSRRVIRKGEPFS